MGHISSTVMLLLLGLLRCLTAPLKAMLPMQAR